MEKKFLISCELLQPAGHYGSLLAELNRLKARRVFEGVWYLSGEHTCEQLRDHLFAFMYSSTDRVLVVRLDDWSGINAVLN